MIVCYNLRQNYISALQVTDRIEVENYATIMKMAMCVR